MTVSNFRAYRRRIFGLILLTFLPLLALNLYTSIEQRANILKQDREEVLTLMRLEAAQLNGFIQSAHDLISAASEMVGHGNRARDAEACVRILVTVQRQSPMFANLGMIEPDGSLHCSIARLTAKTNVADRNYFQRALREKDFVVGEYQIGRVINKPVLPIAKPILDQTGMVKRVLFATVDLLWLNQILANTPLPAGGTILLLDRHGTVLARHPEPQTWVGKNTAATPLWKTIQEGTERISVAQGLDGIERVYAFGAMGGKAGNALYLAIGLTSESEHNLATTILWRNTLIALLTGLLSFAVGWFLINRGLKERETDASQRAQINEKLQQTVQTLEQREREARLLNEMRNQFQIGQSDEEIHKIVSDHFTRLFPTSAGALYLINASRRLAEAVSTWGQMPSDTTVFQPQDCLALRRGQPYTHEPSDGHFGCAHVPDGPARQYACLPLMAHGEMLGTVHLLWPLPDPGATPLASRTKELELARTVSGMAALAVSHSRLLQALKIQAVRDPLTGLFNRRYLEETLEREVARCQRNRSTLAVLMIDVDHFKQFNDRYGHAAGDTALAEIGSLVLKCARASDIACRYGGEELFLILPDCALDAAHAHAQQLLHDVRALEIKPNGQDLGRITVSQGLAMYPQHADNVEYLLRAADAALYRAKREGRDRVVVADAPVTAPTRPPAT
jgi:diguanylate cyclase (GGDEF)-like protein